MLLVAIDEPTRLDLWVRGRTSVGARVGCVGVHVGCAGGRAWCAGFALGPQGFLDTNMLVSAK